MRIDVGTSLTYRGACMLCTRITNLIETQLADIDSETLRAECNESNVHYIESRIEPFKSGEIIQVDIERVELQAPGKDTQYIYTKFYYRKVGTEINNGHEGSERVSGQASGSEAQGLGHGNQGESGLGGSGTGETSDPLHGDGPAREGGAISSAGEGSGREHSDADDGSGNTDRTGGAII